MSNSQSSEGEQRAYDRLLGELSRVIDSAEVSAALGGTLPDELELRGLQPSDVTLIKAYLAGDKRWLSDWLDAVATASTQQPPAPELPSENELVCAQCGSPTLWRAGVTVDPCISCNSRLFLVGKPQ